MKGLELAERYFAAHGAPMLAGLFAAHEARIAAGLAGEGSDCFGFDDEISRDHDWGPAFCLWLTEEDRRAIGEPLAAALKELPACFEGFGPRRETELGAGRTGVLEIGAFYRRLIGLPRAPRSLAEWRTVPEDGLAAATNGRVFRDSLGAFSAVREELLRFFPEPVRLEKIAACCMAIAQAGQYNLPRCAARRELVAARCAEAELCSEAMALVFLLNRRFAPFTKWRHRALAPLPVLGAEAHRLLAEIAATVAFARKQRLIEELCARLVAELGRQGLSDARSDFLLDHGLQIRRRLRETARA